MSIESEHSKSNRPSRYKPRMDPSKKQATGAQITALMDYMQANPELAKGIVNAPAEREQLETHWRELAAILNAMGGAVKAVEKWKQTWRDLKSNSKKRALNEDLSQNEGDSYVPSKKKAVSFDEELLRIEREKLDLDQDYKTKKIEVLSRIATALEALARKREL